MISIFNDELQMFLIMSHSLWNGLHNAFVYMLKNRTKIALYTNGKPGNARNSSSKLKSLSERAEATVLEPN